MRAIWKFPLKITEFQKIEMPKHSSILSVQMQGDQLCVWALVLTDNEPELCGFWVFGTGNPIEQIMHVGPYVGTVQTLFGLVWHVFQHRYD